MSIWNTKNETGFIEEISDHWLKGYFRDSHSNWDGRTWRRNFNELRSRDIALMALGDVRGRRVLDVGCGEGVYCFMLAQLGAIVSGQDLNSEAITKADSRTYGPDGALKGNFISANARKLHFPSNHFDCVFSADFIEHIDTETKQQVISEAYRVLKPGGLLVIKTPNLDYLSLSVQIKRIIALTQLQSPVIFIPHTKNNPDNEHHGLINFSSLRNLLAAHFFHAPRFHFQPLSRKGVPERVSQLIAAFQIKTLSEHIIISTRKSIFVGACE